MKKLAALFSMMMVMLCLAAGISAAENNQSQITKGGGSTQSDSGNVKISKTIAPTGIENYFDITLEVETSLTAETLSAAVNTDVVIVLDRSRTMVDNYVDGLNDEQVSRLKAAQDAAKRFVDTFFSASGVTGRRRIAFVAFDTHANRIINLSSNAATIKEKIDGIKTADAGSPDRYTNIEAGLQLAYNILKPSDADNKYVIFLSDGFPTTWITGDRNNTEMITGKNPQAEPYMRDHVRDLPCLYGTNYSDTGATRAEVVASNLKKSSGANAEVFSIGIGVSDMNLQKFLDQVVDNGAGATVEITSTTYAIGDPKDPKSYENWLKTKIGSNKYADGSSESALDAAYGSIINEIRDMENQKVQEILNAQMVADPMGDNVEFIRFISGNGNGAASQSNGAISWQMSKAQDLNSASDKARYTLKYRVRLKNENGEYAENTSVAANGDAKLTYKDVTKVNGEITGVVNGTLNFPKPQVKGWKVGFEFEKTKSNSATDSADENGAFAGVSFTLKHAANCSVCKASGAKGSLVSIANVTKTSDENGKVRFEDIPSGHDYELTESVPAGYSTPAEKYQVKAAYDTVSVTGMTDGKVNNARQVQPTALQLGAKKILNKEGFVQGAGDFVFTLTEAEDYNGDGKTVFNAQNQTDGTVTFETIPYNKVGTYMYTLKETRGSMANMVYDESEYKVTVTVTGSVNNDGVYVLDRTYSFEKVGGGEAEIALFDNTHMVNLRIEKKSRDFSSVMDDAAFELTHACGDSCSVEIPSRQATESDGYYTFANVMVEHRYELTETGIPENYLDPDTVWSFFLKANNYDSFEVVLDEAYENVAVKNDDQDEEEESYTIQLDIVNIEKYVKTHFDLEAKKLLDGYDVQDEEFTFSVYRADRLPVAPGSTFDLEAYLSGATATPVRKIGETSNVQEKILYEGEETENAAGDPDKLEFTHRDLGKTFYYLIAEEAVAEGRKITGDDRVFAIALTVTAPEGGSEINEQQSLTCTKAYFILNEDGTLTEIDSVPGIDSVPVFDNTSRVDIKLIKYDPNYLRLTGAEFIITHDTENEDSACYGCTEDRIAAIPSTELSGGQYHFSDLYAGHDYLLTETKAPHNYLRPREPWKIRVEATGYKQYELSLRSSKPEGLKINQAEADYANPRFEIEIHDPEKYLEIKHQFAAKKLVDNGIPKDNYIYTFELRRAAALPAAGAGFNLEQYVNGTELVDQVKNQRDSIVFPTQFSYTLHDIYADTGKEFYFVFREVQEPDFFVNRDKTVYLAVVRIDAVGGDDFTRGKLVPRVEYYSIQPDGKLSKWLYDSFGKPDKPVNSVVFRNYHNANWLPNTGDESNLALYGALLALSVAGLVMAVKRRKMN